MTISKVMPVWNALVTAGVEPAYDRRHQELAIGTKHGVEFQTVGKLPGPWFWAPAPGVR
jgi:hypothetical protein